MNQLIENLPLRDYLARPGISKSLLDEFARCPLLALEAMTLPAPPPTRPMIIGQALDVLVCGREKFEECFYVRPETYEGDEGTKPWTGKAIVCQRWLEEHSDRPVLTPDEYEKVQDMADAVFSHPHFRELFYEHHQAQVSLFWTDERTGLSMKARPDFITDRSAIELKTSHDVSLHAMSNQIAALRYHVQAAIYTDALKACGRRCDNFYFIFVESSDRPKVNVRLLTERALDLGRFTYQQLLAGFKTCQESNYWPDYSGPGIDVVDLPVWCYKEEFTITIGGQDATL